ncbi:MAG TPA: hypothetical protein VM686_07085 [Polyangiaceae bacterium]|nr:hypothetical protein [Polyangiaceae bacterium]
MNNQGGSSGNAGGMGPGGSTGTSGSGATAQGGDAGTSGAPAAGSAAVGGSAGTSGSGGSAGTSGAMAGGGTGGLEEGDTPPWRELMVLAAPDEHLHGNAGLDNRAKPLGKLVVDIGVNSGGYQRWAAKRGYHSIGAPCGGCPAPNLGAGREEVGNCRLEEFANTEASVKQTLSDLHAQFPEEDWGYFLNQDGSVRWSDVAITGISHGATTAAIAGRLGARMWRVVSRSGPRDNTCGLGDGECTVPLSTPSYDTACPDEDVAAWLDMPSLTPMNRFYGLVGTTDGQCGDIMFNMHRTGYIGVPVLFNEGGADLTTSNQYFSTEGGHYDFLAAPDGVPNTNAALNIAFGIPPENQNPDF